MALCSSGLSDFETMKMIAGMDSEKGRKSAVELINSYTLNGKCNAYAKLVKKAWKGSWSDLEVLLSKSNLLNQDVNLSEEEQKKFVAFVWKVASSAFKGNPNSLITSVRWMS